jgi:hypothetical protein
MNIDFSVEMENGTLVSEVMSPELANKLIHNWVRDLDYVEFGGGVRDLPCRAVLDACDGSVEKLVLLAPSISKSDARLVIAACKEGISLDV